MNPKIKPIYYSTSKIPVGYIINDEVYAITYKKACSEK